MSAHFLSAAQHLHADRLAEAEAACRSGLEEAPGDLRGLSLLAVALHRMGKMEAAAAACREAAGRHPQSNETWINLGVILQNIGSTHSARHAFQRLSALDPASLTAAQRLGVTAQELGDSAEALRRAGRAARIDPFAAGVLFNLGVVRMVEGDPAGAVVSLRALVAVAPGDPVGYRQLAGCLLGLGDVAAAAGSYERAIRLDPANADGLDGRARCLRYRVAQAAARHPDIPPGVLIRGPYQGVSGYAHMTNHLVDAMSAAGTRTHVLGLMGRESWASPLETMARGRAIVSCQTPPTVEIAPGLKTVNLSMFEGTRIPLSWRRHSDRHDLVIVPTESSRIAWAERGYPEDRLRLCPLGVDPEIPTGEQLDLRAEDGRPLAGFRHRILNISDFIPRKNLDGVLRVWLRSTRADDDAALVLKPGKSGGAQAQFEALFRQTEAIVGKSRRQAAPVFVVTGALDEESMTGLFRSATHYWSLSHGEGWDLPMSKAGAMGLQLIAPAHSSYVDYLDDAVARMIPSATGPAHLPNSREPWPTFFGLDWWEPDEDAAAELIGRIVRGEDARRLDARSHLAARFTWAQAAERLVSVLRETNCL